MEENTQTNTAAAAARPAFLTVLCILSFIAAGFAVIGYITAITVMGAASAIASGMEGMGEEAAAAGAMLNEAMSSGPSAGLTWAYVIVGFLCTLVGLFGVIKMWKLQKVGFYLYVATSVISLVMGIVYSGFGMFSFILTALFIVLYGLNLKHLK